MSKTALWNDVKALVSKLEDNHPLTEEFLECLEYHKTYEQKRIELRNKKAAPKPAAARSWVKPQPPEEEEEDQDADEIFSGVTTEQERITAIKRLLA